MTVVAVTGGKAGRGATTAALALGLSWPGPVLLVDADACGGDMVPGMLPGRVGTERGLLSWLVATRRNTVLESAQVAGRACGLVAGGPCGVADCRESNTAGSRSLWPRGVGNGWLGYWRGELTAGGRDVIVDTGRLSSGSCWPVLAVADQVLLVVRPTARSVQGRARRRRPAAGAPG